MAITYVTEWIVKLYYSLVYIKSGTIWLMLISLWESYLHCFTLYKAKMGLSNNWFNLPNWRLFGNFCVLQFDCEYATCEFGWNAVCSSRPGQNGHHFADYIFRCIFLDGKQCIWIQISSLRLVCGTNMRGCVTCRDLWPWTYVYILDKFCYW